MQAEAPSQSARRESPTARHARRALFFGFSLAMTIGVFSILFRHVTWLDVRNLIVNISLPRVGAFIGFSMLQLLLRTYRYWILLRASGETPPPFALFLVVVVRGLCVDMLPARAGELVYIFLVRTRLAVDLGAATASFALAFLFDVLALAPLLVIGAAAMGGNVGISPAFLIGGAAFLLAVSLALIAAMIPVLGFGKRLIRPLAARGIGWAEWIDHTCDTVVDSLRVAREKRLFWKLFGTSVLIRISKYSSLYFLMFALLAPLEFDFASAPPAEVFVALVSGEMAASLPVSGIGGFGAYEGTMTYVFVLLGFEKSTAAAMTLSHRLLTQLYGLILGLLALLTLMLPVFNQGNRSGCFHHETREEREE